MQFATRPLLYLAFSPEGNDRLKITLKTQQFVAIFATVMGVFASPVEVKALDRASADSNFGISLTGQLPTVAGPFAPVLSPQLGGSLGVDMNAPGFEGSGRLFLMAGIQNYGIQNTPLLSLSTFEAFAGLGLRSEPYFWAVQPTLNIGIGATIGTLQVDGTTAETANSAAYFSTLVSPGVSARLFAGLSAGVELPVRWVFSQNRITTLSPALTLRYEL